MPVLSNLQILAALETGRMRISPRPAPSPDDKDTPYNTSSVDLRLASELLIPRAGLSLTFDLRRGGDGVAETIDRVCDRFVIPDSGFVLEPNRFILGRTIEEVAFPLDGRLAARVEGRSSLARTGLLIHFTAPTIHAGFEGTITLEIMNLGPLALVLTPELRICQLIVETIEGEPLPAPSQFHGQGTPRGR